jgi:hypothetical protein
MHNCIIDCLARQQYYILKLKHRYQINRYCKLLNKQKLNNGCWKLDFNKILLTHCKYKSLIWIYRWTHCATRWQPTQFRRVQSLPWNRTRVGSSGLLTTRTTNLATDQFGPGPGPKVTVWDRCLHQAWVVYRSLGTDHRDNIHNKWGDCSIQYLAWEYLILCIRSRKQEGRYGEW